MNIEEILKRFCDPESTIIVNKAPFNQRGKTYATNGSVIIEVPEIEGLSEYSRPAKIAEMINNHEINSAAMQKFAWPELPKPVTIICSECNGEGKIFECPECEGDGYVTWNSGRFVYEAECQLCFGEGKLKESNQKCEECEGTGRITQLQTVKVGGSVFNVEYLRWFEGLDELTLMVDPENHKRGAVVHFEGGRGLIMPRTSD